jgi:hypothetical protein
MWWQLGNSIRAISIAVIRAIAMKPLALVMSAGKFQKPKSSPESGQNAPPSAA